MDDFLTFWGEVDQYLRWGEGIDSSLKMFQLDQFYPFLHLFVRAIASDAQNLGGMGLQLRKYCGELLLLLNLWGGLWIQLHEFELVLHFGQNNWFQKKGMRQRKI